jgi:hypothetical protein
MFADGMSLSICKQWWPMYSIRSPETARGHLPSILVLPLLDPNIPSPFLTILLGLSLRFGLFHCSEIPHVPSCNNPIPQNNIMLLLSQLICKGCREVEEELLCVVAVQQGV